MAFYKIQTKARNITAHYILKNEVDLILNFMKDRKVREEFSVH